MFKKSIIVYLSALLFSFTVAAKSEPEVSKNVPLKIEALSSKVYLVTSYKTILNVYESDTPKIIDANALLYISGKDAYLIDTPWNVADMPQLMDWIEDKGLTLKDTVITHSHEDRSAGLGYLSEHGFSTYASALTNSLLKAEHKPVATNTFEGDTFDLIKGEIEIYYSGPGHAIDNLVVWLPKEKILFGGCMLRANEAEGLGWIGDADLEQWHQSVLNVKNKYADIKLVIPGHGKIGHDQSMITHTLNLTK
ncbi:subclass B1 metallo-beta-lactamase [Moritella dasanensis]|uniref:subclass B1 metallo-beta-lactamase n=1 Tax=Moritella dasanensis TaxID=428031 RepID=UPI00030C2910|nr:subclass B1 metallo-beta-lactamase [Moritella dasanensis]